MTAHPDSDADCPGDDPVDGGIADVPHPLSGYVNGVLTVHFDAGAVVKHGTSQFDARAFLTKQTDAENSDDITWDSRNWFHWAHDRVVFSSFKADRDQNWAVTPEDRRKLSTAGHPDGVVASLVSFWGKSGRGPEPVYSIRAIVTLHQIALHGADRATWKTAARTCAGSRGAAMLAALSRGARQKDPPSEDSHGQRPGVDLRAEDDAEPENAAEAAPDLDQADSPDLATEARPPDEGSPDREEAE